MLAKNLEAVLHDLYRDGDVHTIAPGELGQRFESLRGYGRLPRGRENRSRPLTDSQIASAIMGLVPVDAQWAGHGAAILEKLRPVGGESVAFRAASTLMAALTAILRDESARASLVGMRMTVSETGTHSHGSAAILYEEAGIRRWTFYVPSEAVSLLQPGRENGYNQEPGHAPFAREAILNRRFFERLARSVQNDRNNPRPATGDGSEYDAFEAEQARLKRLGVTPRSHFLHAGVDTQVTWPKQEMLVKFDEYQLVLLPKTGERTQSVHIDLYQNQLSHDQALTVINRFLSILAWCDNQFAIVEGSWAGGSMPVPVPKRSFAFANAYQWYFFRTIPGEEQPRRALALYREGLNADEAALASYAVLSFFKVIELGYRESNRVKKWIKRTFPAVLHQAGPSDARMAAFLSDCGVALPENYIWDACRLAVAHASVKSPSDADDAAEIRRLSVASYVLQLLARRFIAERYKIAANPLSDTVDDL